MFSLYGKDDRTDRERYLEDELEREREQSRLEDERREKEREERRKELHQQWAYEERQAGTWAEAFQKQANLCWREHNQYPEEEAEDDQFFKYTALANEKALELWHEVSANKQAELDALQKQIEAVWEAVRNEVADKLEAADEHKEYRYVASAIRDDELDGYLNW
jgi:hypothetical protein